MSDSSAFILGFINVVEDARFCEASHENVKTIHRSLVDKIIGSTTVQERFFGHFVFVKNKADINAVLLITNIHSTYL